MQDEAGERDAAASPPPYNSVHADYQFGNSSVQTEYKYGTMSGIEVECRSLSGDSWCVVLPNPTIAELRASLSTQASGKLFAEGRVLEDDDGPLPMPADGGRLIVHVAPTVVLESLDPLDRAILLDLSYIDDNDDASDACVAPDSPTCRRSPMPLAPPSPPPPERHCRRLTASPSQLKPATPQLLEEPQKRRCVAAAALLIAVSIGVGASSGIIYAGRVQRQQPERANSKAVAIAADMGLAHPRLTLPWNSVVQQQQQQQQQRHGNATHHSATATTSQRFTAALGPGGLPRLRGLAWSQPIGTEEAVLPGAFLPPSRLMADDEADVEEERAPSHSLPVATRARWQVMALPVLTSVLALVQPVGRRVFFALMALARRALPSRRCGTLQRYLSQRGLAFGGDLVDLCRM